jgi:pimeloyl-ACP methyl ester carboxylesterase
MTRHELPRSSVRASDGTRLFVREWGSGQPILFVHSWALSSEMWARQFVTLGAQGFRCIAYDRRGHGRSDAPPHGYDMDTLADDLAQVIEGLELSDLLLVGHSMGAAEIVRYLATRGSERISRVALFAPATPFMLQTDDNPLGLPLEAVEAIRAHCEADFPGFVEANKRPFFAQDTSLELMDWLARMMMSTPLPVALATQRSSTEADLRADLRSISVPVLVIQGDRDMSAPLEITGRPTAAAIADCQLKIYPGAPHGLFLTHADRLNADLAHFAACSGTPSLLSRAAGSA